MPSSKLRFGAKMHGCAAHYQDEQLPDMLFAAHDQDEQLLLLLTSVADCKLTATLQVYKRTLLL